MALYNMTEFLRLSAALNYQLTAAETPSGNILAIVLGRKHLPENEKAVLLRVIKYLTKAYGQRKRRLGPLAVLHPLRATAMLARAEADVSLLDLLSELLHDKLEDIRPEDFPLESWQELEGEFLRLIKQIDPTDEWFLMERLDMLTKRKETETYHQYIGRLLEKAQMTPELVRVKLADRLDNTLDMHIEHEDPMEDFDFYAFYFQTMFVRTYPGYKPAVPHAELVPFYGARRLYELFKNAAMLSLVRKKKDISTDESAQTLFNAISSTSMEEAQRMIVHIFGYHLTDIREQRRLLRKFMGVLQENTEDSGPLAYAECCLEDLFCSRIDILESATRLEMLNALYKDKPLMVEAAMSFILTFMSFLNDPAYFLPCIPD